MEESRGVRWRHAHGLIRALPGCDSIWQRIASTITTNKGKAFSFGVDQLN
jgi:hypothetical protein